MIQSTKLYSAQQELSYKIGHLLLLLNLISAYCYYYYNKNNGILPSTMACDLHKCKATKRLYETQFVMEGWFTENNNFVKELNRDQSYQNLY